MNRKEDRWQTLKDVLLFQGKLLIDGVRDLLLSPVSIAAALIDLIVPGDDKGRRFYSVVRFGRRTEEWINLFGAADRHDPDINAKGIDALVEELEAVVRNPERREDVRAKAQVLLRRLQERSAAE
ncbi:MAG: hypothetical protein KY410_04255 [Proteobacteria bacterium]|nr:hypothetical protein [Pseudomonadota bacterium]